MMPPSADAAVDGLMVSKFRTPADLRVPEPGVRRSRQRTTDSSRNWPYANWRAERSAPASDPASEIGATRINARAVEKIERHVRDAVERGARVVVRPRGLRNGFARFELLRANVACRKPAAQMACSGQETFGPRVLVTRVRDESRGRCGSATTHRTAWPRTSSRSAPRPHWRVADDSLAGGPVGINEGALAAEAAPFRGVKDRLRCRRFREWAWTTTCSSSNRVRDSFMRAAMRRVGPIEPLTITNTAGSFTHAAVLGSGARPGTTIAHHLARHGYEVTVLDRYNGPALETSYANAGEVSPATGRHGQDRAFPSKRSSGR